MPESRLEKFHVDQFLKLLEISDNAKVQQPPEPDFFIKINGRLIGIEHTRLVRNKDQNGVNIMAHSKYADQIMRKAESLFNNSASYCLMVHADFKCSYGLMSPVPHQLVENDVQCLSEFIYTFILDKLEIIKSMGHMGRIAFDTFDYNTFQQILPEKIDHISVTNTCDFKNSCWEANQGGTIPGIFDSKEFENLLSKKNKKPSNYKNKYDELWLLIVEDSMDLTSYFHFDNQNVPQIDTSYDKVFILRRSENEIIELKTKLF